MARALITENDGSTELNSPSGSPQPARADRPSSGGLRVLACPASWFLSDSFGSEPTWSFKIMEEGSTRFGNDYLAYCNASEVSRAVPGIRIVDLGREEGKTVEGTARFTWRYFRAAMQDLKRSRFELLHHMFPFGFQEGFNPLAIFDRLGPRRFVLGPIQLPQRFFDPSDFQLTLGMGTEGAAFRQTLENFGSAAARRLFGGMHRKTLEAADFLVFDGDTTRRLYLSTFPELDEGSTAVIPQGVDTQMFRPRTEYQERPVEIMTASYFTRRKGLEYLVRALARIVKSRPEVKLRACGKGPVVPEAERLAGQLGVRDNLILQGFVPMTDLGQYYSTARVYVQPSLSETLPSAVLQALACGAPVVATRVGLLAEFLGGSEAVTLVPPRDPEALAEAVLRALDAMPRTSAAARKHAERFHAWPVIAEQWKRAYDAALVGG